MCCFLCVWVLFCVFYLFVLSSVSFLISSLFLLFLFFVSHVFPVFSFFSFLILSLFLFFPFFLEGRGGGFFSSCVITFYSFSLLFLCSSLFCSFFCFGIISTIFVFSCFSLFFLVSHVLLFFVFGAHLFVSWDLNTSSMKSTIFHRDELREILQTNCKFVTVCKQKQSQLRTCKDHSSDNCEILC